MYTRCCNDDIAHNKFVYKSRTLCKQMTQFYRSEQVTKMCNLFLFILYLYALFTTALTQVVDVENKLLAEGSILPYSLKATVGNDNGARYKLLAVNLSNNQGVESELVERHNMNNPQNRRSEDPWDRISANYKNQLTAVNSPIDEFGYFNTYGATPHKLHSDINHFGVGTVAASVALSLLVLNFGIFLYLFINTASVLSAAAVSSNFRLPYNMHEYLRRDEYSNKYN